MRNVIDSSAEASPNKKALKGSAWIFAAASAVLFVALIVTCPPVEILPNLPAVHKVSLVGNILLPLIVLAYSVIRIRTFTPRLIFLFLVPSLALFLDGYFAGYHINHFTDLLPLGGAVTGALMLIFLVYFFRPMNLTVKGAILAIGFVILPLMAFYGLTAVRSLNWGLDQSSPRIVQARVVSKSTSYDTDTGTDRWLTLERWEEMSSNVDIGVGASTYDSAQKGDLIEVFQMKGILDIPWYYFAIYTYKVR